VAGFAWSILAEYLRAAKNMHAQLFNVFSSLSFYGVQAAKAADAARAEAAAKAKSEKLAAKAAAEKAKEAKMTGWVVRCGVPAALVVPSPITMLDTTLSWSSCFCALC